MSGDGDKACQMEQIWLRLASMADHVNTNLNLAEKMEQCKKYAKEHPFVSLFLIVNLAMSSIPIACFLSFAVGTIIMTLLGFVFLEGNCVWHRFQ